MFLVVSRQKNRIIIPSAEWLQVQHSSEVSAEVSKSFIFIYSTLQVPSSRHDIERMSSYNRS